MTFYAQKIDRIKEVVYKNQGQLDAAIAVRSYIRNHYETDLNLDLLSETQLISKYHLLRLFKQYFGLTPRQYLIDTRIEKAKEHLKRGRSVTETCFAVGFNSLGSFSALFKTRTGKSPTQYRKEQFSRSK